MRWVLWFFGAFQCENNPSKRPIFSLFAKEAQGFAKVHKYYLTDCLYVINNIL